MLKENNTNLCTYKCASHKVLLVFLIRIRILWRKSICLSRLLRVVLSKGGVSLQRVRPLFKGNRIVFWPPALLLGHYENKGNLQT